MWLIYHDDDLTLLGKALIHEPYGSEASNCSGIHRLQGYVGGELRCYTAFDLK